MNTHDSLDFLDDHQDEAWRVQDALTRTPQTPSAIGRKAKVKTSRAATILYALVTCKFATSEGNGAWEKYAQMGYRR